MLYQSKLWSHTSTLRDCCLVAFALALVVTIECTGASAQSTPSVSIAPLGPPNQSVIVNGNPIRPQYYESRVDANGQSIMVATDGPSSEEYREMQAANEQLKSKTSDAETKQAARRKMTEILGKQFDRDLDQRTKQIGELEKQLVTLKEQIEKRRTVKDRLIELRLELAMNEAEGLGFPSGWNQPLIRPATSPTATTLYNYNSLLYAPGQNSPAAAAPSGASPLTTTPAARP
jgi:hypothetical protein